MRKVGVVGSLVWDVIHGRDPRTAPVEEWGGIAYALSSLDAHLPEGWEIVPLIKVGSDLHAPAERFLRSLARLAPGARPVEVPVPNNRVVLRYESNDRRCERMSGGVPGWTWPELGPMVRDLDALYLNFISGFELSLGTAEALRQGFAGPIYADLHSLFLGMQQDGTRTLRPLPHAAAWFRCFDFVQVNEDEMRQLADEPMAVAAVAMAEGVRVLTVTLGPRGAAYFTADADPVIERRTDGGSMGQPVRTSLVPAKHVDDPDPTGCGDVFGAALFARLLAREPVEVALRDANDAAARNAGFRGADGLARHLRGELVTP
ncbi:MAG TPA: PfkB family carbohydrate kinase [Gemmatimonadales bacterium]|nr:PfkB family carbohydrate kinase [Gemmatimonadales bacterium]